MPYRFIGFGAIAITKPCKFIGFGAIAITKPYNFVGCGAIAINKPYKFIGFGAIAHPQFGFRYPGAMLGLSGSKSGPHIRKRSATPAGEANNNV